jgi:thiamine kinase-like enzyme
MYKKQILRIIKNNGYFNKNYQHPKTVVKDLGMGENNLNYLATIDGDKYVFRISIKKHLEKNACKEFKFLKFIPIGIAPGPIYMDKTKKDIPYYYSVLGYVEGESHNKWNKNEIRIHAQAMAKLHAKKYDYWQTSGHKKKRFSMYEKLLRDMKGYKGVITNPKIVRLVKDFKGYIRRNDHYFTELKKFRFIHGDLCADNVLFHKGAIHYIDWEWCGIRDNAEDIARVYFKGRAIRPWYIKLDDKELKYMLDEYSRYIEDETLGQRVEIWNTYSLFMDMIYFFWKEKNYGRFKSKLPKKNYVSAAKILLEYYSRYPFK